MSKTNKKKSQKERLKTKNTKMVLAIERCLAYDSVIRAFRCCCCWCRWWTLPIVWLLFSLSRHLSDSLARVTWRVFHSKLRQDFMRVSLLIHAASSLMGTRDSNGGHAPSRQLGYTSSLPICASDFFPLKRWMKTQISPFWQHKILNSTRLWGNQLS